MFSRGRGDSLDLLEESTGVPVRSSSHNLF
jgi:hypothetical protein